MAPKIKFIDGLAYSGKGNSKWWGVAKNSANGGAFYVAADLICDDNKVRTRSYRPDGFNLTERESAIIATELYRLGGYPFPDGHVIDPQCSTGITFRIEGRFIKAFDKHGMPFVMKGGIQRRGNKLWAPREVESKSPQKKGGFAKLAGTDPFANPGVAPNNPIAPIQQNIEDMASRLKSKLSDDDWRLVELLMKDSMGESEIHPAVKTFAANLLTGS